ncbi:three-Cys-motif partner protein TcmP [Adhaeribacter radiodurans]|uniref:Three-Cys-motif partner protein TcmP n=1 Tax=Adhaeribacter radiodurans TaxID=2745197 RepID=A0A7L7LBY4_9BACT|nr:three-Cys-motif partner protein TcmP [Adhaeribacter radiodurans]QMU30214.1 three-Cys-motif partner protein TcmP [Adhaeribacter radiodurans]
MSVVETNTFFKQKRTAAEIKYEILKSYFTDWCAQVLQTTPPAELILYIDLLAGNTFTEENIITGPGLILEQIYQTKDKADDLNSVVKTFFYDATKAVLDKLSVDFEQLSFLENVEHLPVILNNPDQRVYLAGLLNKQIPALFITNPFSNLFTQELLAPAVLQTQADLFLLFSPNKLRSFWELNQETNNLSFLMGESLTVLKQYAQKESSGRKREQFTVDTLVSSLQEKKYFPLVFKINLPDKAQTSHYLLFAAKTQEAYFLMKETIARYSDFQEDGVPLFSINQKPQMPLLPGFFQYLSKYTYAGLLETLSDNRRQFHYRTIQEIYEEHAVGTNFIKANYLQAFTDLRQQGRVNLVNEQNKQVKTVSEKAIVFYKLHSSK